MDDDDRTTDPNDINGDGQTSYDDTENTNTRYANSLYNDDENTDYYQKDDFNPASSDLDAGIDDDAFQTYDSDDSTLPSENDNDETETGMDEVDADNISPLQDQMGDTVVDDDFSDEIDEEE